MILSQTFTYVHEIIYVHLRCRYCSPGTLDRNLVEGKIVVCDFQTDVTEAIVAGAAGTILQGDDFRDVAYNTPIAASYLTLHDGNEVETYLNSTRYILNFLD